MVLDQIRFLLLVDFSASSASLLKQRLERKVPFLILTWWLSGNLDALELQVVVPGCFYPCPMLHRDCCDYSTPSAWRRARAWLTPLSSSAEGQTSLITNQSCECSRHEHGQKQHRAICIRKAECRETLIWTAFFFQEASFTHSKPEYAASTEVPCSLLGEHISIDAPAKLCECSLSQAYNLLLILAVTSHWHNW